MIELHDLITNRGPGTYYNVEDINRVGEAVQLLADILRAYGYNADVDPKTDWTEDDYPTRTEMERYLANIRALTEAYAVLTTTPELPESMRFLGYEGANNIEQILLDIETLIQNMVAAFRYSGTFYAGTEGMQVWKTD